MPLPLANTFDGGTDGTTISAANSGGASGDAWDAVTVGASSVFKYVAGQGLHGPLCAELSTSTVSESAFGQYRASTDGLQDTLYGRAYFKFSAWPPSNSSILSALSTTTARWRLQILTTGKVRIIDAASATVTTSVMSLDVNTWWRIEFWAFLSATLGDCSTVIYPGDSKTASETNNAPAATQNFGGTADTYRAGCVANQINFPQTWMDSVQFNRTGFPGPLPFIYRPRLVVPQAVARASYR